VSFLLQTIDDASPHAIAVMIVENWDLGNWACPHDLEFEERLDKQAHAARNQTCWLRSQSIGYRAAADVPFGGRIEIEVSTSPLIVERVDLQS